MVPLLTGSAWGTHSTARHETKESDGRKGRRRYGMNKREKLERHSLCTDKTLHVVLPSSSIRSNRHETYHGVPLFSPCASKGHA